MWLPHDPLLGKAVICLPTIGECPKFQGAGAGILDLRAFPITSRRVYRRSVKSGKMYVNAAYLTRNQKRRMGTQRSYAPRHPRPRKLTGRQISLGFRTVYVLRHTDIWCVKGVPNKSTRPNPNKSKTSERATRKWHQIDAVFTKRDIGPVPKRIRSYPDVCVIRRAEFDGSICNTPWAVVFLYLTHPIGRRASPSISYCWGRNLV